MSHAFYELKLDDEFIEDLRSTLEDMIDPVDIEVYVGPHCPTCEDTLKLMKAFEDNAPNGKVRLHVYEKGKDDAMFRKRDVERIPTVMLLEGQIRYTGIPAGEEIHGFIETLMRISEGESGLEPETIEVIKSLKNKVYIEVIVTPPCPYCPYAALLANMLAFESYKYNKLLYSDTVEAYENPDIADKYQVMSVPAIAINGHKAFLGLPFEKDFINYIKLADEGRYERFKLMDYGQTSGL